MQRKVKWSVIESKDERSNQKIIPFPSEDLARFYFEKKYKLEQDWELEKVDMIANGIHYKDNPKLTILMVYTKKEK